MKFKLYDFQKEGVEFLVSGSKHKLLADEMGLGKTIQAIVACFKLKAKTILVICPSSVKINWYRKFCELEQIYSYKGLHCKVIVNKYSDIIVNKKQANVVILNYDLLMSENIRKQLSQLHFDVGICDEAHYLKNAAAKRTKYVLGAKGAIRSCDYKFMLTGTPILNRPIELYPMLKVLKSQTIKPYDSYVRFATRYCGGYHGKWGFEAKGATHTAELSRKLNGFMLRRTCEIEEVAAQLPDVTIDAVEFDPNSRLVKIMDAADNIKDEDRSEVEGLGRLATLRRMIGEEKVALCCKHIEDALEAGEKVTLFAYHKTVIDLLARKLYKYRPVKVIGGMNAEAKQESIDTFINDDKCRVFIGQIEAAGQGVDGLQLVSRVCMFVELSWVPGQLDQALKRLHRLGQHFNVLVQFLIVTGTLDESMVLSINRKKSIIEKIINRGRG